MFAYMFLRILGQELTKFLTPSSFHNLWCGCQSHLSLPIVDDIHESVNQCIQFIEFGANISYVHAIVSVFGIVCDWEKNDNMQQLYNYELIRNIPELCKEQIKIIFRLLHSTPLEQNRINKCIKFGQSPFYMKRIFSEDKLIPFVAKYLSQASPKHQQQLLFKAIQHGSMQIVTYLIDNGVSFGDNHLSICARLGHLKLVKMFLNRDHNLNDSIACFAAVEGDIMTNTKKVLQYLIDNGANPNYQHPEWKISALFITLRLDSPSYTSFDILLESDMIDLDCQDKFGQTPLMIAVCLHSLKDSEYFVSHLLLGGANPNVKCKKNFSALDRARGRKRNTIVEMLLRSGAL